jgi:hypothetical protein
MQLTTVATPQGKYPKIMTTTGACTKENYTDSKAGKKGEFHHYLGAVVVEIKGKKFHMRQLAACKDGSFIDLDTEYTPESVHPAPRAAALVLGDTHRAFTDRKVERATFGLDGMSLVLKPEYLVFHDLHDGYAENPHNSNHPLIKVAKADSGLHNVEKEIEQDYQWLWNVTLPGQKAVVVASNHDDFLARWIYNTDWRTLGSQAKFYLRTALNMVKSAEMTKNGAQWDDPLSFWLEWHNERADDPIDLRCLKVDESFMLHGIELGMHGHLGPNGARGSRNNLKKIGVKSVIGHGHGPGIEEGCTQVGTSSPLRLEYNHGPSSWLNAHCVIYANGKRSLLNIIDGQWRL